jgi:hypothetical protein
MRLKTAFAVSSTSITALPRNQNNDCDITVCGVTNGLNQFLPFFALVCIPTYRLSQEPEKDVWQSWLLLVRKQPAHPTVAVTEVIGVTTQK